MKTVRAIAAAAAMTVTAGAAAQAQSIAEIAATDGRFDTLVAAVTAAGLADTLAGAGHFTVFAPTDDAFAALPAGVVDTLLLDENIGTLTSILLYHVEDAVIPSSAIPHGTTQITPLYNRPLCVTLADGKVTLDDGTGPAANVIIADIAADNGVIHVIDRVLLPTATPNCH